MTDQYGFDGEQYAAGREAGEGAAEAGKDFHVWPDAHRDFKTGYAAGYDNWFSDPCDNRAEEAFTRNLYDF